MHWIATAFQSAGGAGVQSGLLRDEHKRVFLPGRLLPGVVIATHVCVSTTMCELCNFQSTNSLKRFHNWFLWHPCLGLSIWNMKQHPSPWRCSAAWTAVFFNVCVWESLFVCVWETEATPFAPVSDWMFTLFLDFAQVISLPVCQLAPIVFCQCTNGSKHMGFGLSFILWWFEDFIQYCLPKIWLSGRTDEGWEGGVENEGGSERRRGGTAGVNDWWESSAVCLLTVCVTVVLGEKLYFWTVSPSSSCVAPWEHERLGLTSG